MAFQRNAFQSRPEGFGFQVERDAHVTGVGGRIVAGTFSRGQWRDLKRDLEARRLEAKRKREQAEAALEAERSRKIEAIAAEIAARHAAEDQAHAAAMAALQAKGFNPSPALSAAELAAAHAAHANKLAQLAHAKRVADEEEEAIALLLM